jgi:hypothetical protein
MFREFSIMVTSFLISKSAQESNVTELARIGSPQKITRSCDILKVECTKDRLNLVFFCLFFLGVIANAPLKAESLSAKDANARQNLTARQDVSARDAIITHPLTGEALMGYDPVSYFIGAKPRLGQAAHAVHLGEKTWIFENAGNRAAFLKNPDLYIPSFGGHDPVMIAKGVAVRANPANFALIGGKLYLFRNAENRDLVLRMPGMIEDADRHWPKVKRDLVF